MNYGATPDEWAHLSVMLGLTADLLPVVSNTAATISGESKMRDIGKTPSRYNGSRHVAGISNWTSHIATIVEIDKWREEPDYGICIQTRSVRALDIDISDVGQAEAVRSFIRDRFRLPTRSRTTAPKFLLAFTLPGNYTKRVIRTEHGIIEFLATGQQFIACGTHPSGVRYEWEGGLPDILPTVGVDAFEALWRDLEQHFAVAPSTTAKASTRHEVLLEAHKNDPVAVHLLDSSMVFSSEKDGALNILCPFTAEHTTVSAESATRYWPRFTGGYERGHFKCLHAHCEHRLDHDFLEALGLADTDALDFAPILPLQIADAPVAGKAATEEVNPPRYTFQRVAQFRQGKPPAWIVKGVLPQAALGVIFGEPGSGKTFFAFDLAAAVAEGVDWRQKRTVKGLVAYIAAEGASGFRNRAAAYCEEHGVTLDNLLVLADTPNFTDKADVGLVLDALRPFGHPPSLIVIDTLAQVMAGANENSGEDVGLVLKHCRALHKATGALVVLVHHSGKDSTKGARGWSGLKGAADVEIEVERVDDMRGATITKMKDGEDGASFGFELRTVILGMDEDSEPITSCVVEATGKERVMPVKRPKLGTNEKIVLNAVKGLVSLPDGVADREEVYTICLPKITKTGERDRRREFIGKALNSLQAERWIAVEGEVIRLPDTE